MRSLIVAPADEERLAEALASGADGLVVDLALAPPSGKAAARVLAARFLEEARARRGGPALIVGLGALDSGAADLDLDAIMAGAPDAILLSRSLGGASVQQLSSKLAVREAELALADGATRIIGVADTARSLFALGSYRDASARLIGLSWNAESLRSDIGAEGYRDPSGGLAGPYRLARDLTLLAATAAGVAAIDTAFADVSDVEGLRVEAEAARRDGFAGKMAMDAVQAHIINAVFASRSLPLMERGPSRHEGWS
jgi:citrate lyase subunit beta / citryl-CoA lyase